MLNTGQLRNTEQREEADGRRTVVAPTLLCDRRRRQQLDSRREQELFFSPGSRLFASSQDKANSNNLQLEPSGLIDFSITSLIGRQSSSSSSSGYGEELGREEPPEREFTRRACEP